MIGKIRTKERINLPPHPEHFSYVEARITSIDIVLPVGHQ